MAEDRLTIDAATIEDNSDQRQVEFDAEVSGDRYQFAVQYDVLEALAAAAPGSDASAIFRSHSATIAAIGVRALARDPDQDRVTISENDLD